MSDDSPSLFAFLGDFFKFNFFSNGVSNKESESELRLLLDCVILQKPLLLAEGFVVYVVSSTGQQTRTRITSLNDLAVSKSYVTEKGTSLFRRAADELVLGDRIAMPIRKPSMDDMEKGKLYVVMRGRLLPQTLLLALENFTNKKLSDGLLFHDLNTENRPRIIKNLAELQPGVVLVRDDATERAEICLLKNGRIRFRFLCASSELTQFLHEGRYFAAAHAASARSAGDGVPRVFDGAAQSPPQRFDAPEPQALTRRIAQIAANHVSQRLRFRGKSGQQQPGTPHPAESTAQLLSTPRRRERLTPRHSKAVFSAAGHTPPDDGEVVDMVDPRLAARASPLASHAFRASAAAIAAAATDDGAEVPAASTAVRRQTRAASSSLKQLSSPIEPETPGISKALYETLVLASPPPTGKLAGAGAMAPPPPPPPPPMKRGAGAAGKEKKKRLRALHWNTVGKVDKDSFWGQQMPGDMPGEDVVDTAKLETLFALSPAKKPGDNGAPTPRKAATLVASAASRGSVIGIQKSAMLGVLLRGAKLAVTPTDAADALMACDASVLDAQTLRALADVHSMLDGHEVQQLVAFARAQESSLADGQSTNGVPLAEQCIAWMLHRVPRVKERIDVLWLRERFADELAHIGSEMEPVERACEQLRTSAKFGGMLRLVFALGSVLNRGSYLGGGGGGGSGASGFRLDSLLRLVDTRGRDKELSLLDYLVSTVRSSMPDLEAFPDELTACDEASRLALTDIMAAAQSLCDAVDRAKAEAMGGAADPVLAAALAPFLARADGEASALKARAANVRDTFASLCAFFGEDAAQPPSTNQFFGNVVKFIGDYRASVARLNDAEAKKRRPAPIKKPSARTLRATVLKPVEGVSNGRPSPKRTRSKARLAAIEAAEACDSAAAAESAVASTSVALAASPTPTKKRLVFQPGND